MTCLPFGLSTAPKIFACLTNWVAQILREKGLRLVVYLDDYLIVTSRPERIVRARIVWDPWSNHKYLPQEKSAAIVTKVTRVLESGKETLKDLQSLVGVFNFASFAVPRGRLNHRATLNFLNTLPDQMVSMKRSLPDQVRRELHWWLKNCHLATRIHVPPPIHFLVTDASDLAWGAQLDIRTLSGTWNVKEQQLHSNQKELLAILKVLENHAEKMAGSSIMIQSDNRSAVAYLRNEGGTKSQPLTKLTHRILQIMDDHRIHFKIHHIPGLFNPQADSLSRLHRPPEWHLMPNCTKIVFVKMGTPVIELFASKTARVVANYATLDLKDHEAMYHDAFSIPWNFPLAWIFPPPFLIPKVLIHLNQATGLYLIVVPRWEKVFWRADLKSRSVAPPFTLTNLKRFLIDTTTGLPPPKVQDMTLEIWKCGGGLRS
ncbi:uncharacterized protein LOC124530496 [Vanessa cardui]|uniref:uncharacterized protein LOC124530496 n=1 Tax=Vanessa cardui TaxID=171605 RepID=UPI001F130A8F|nr:uncharacterized protein LOC124530496 [Vanessa cardui]